MPALSSPGAQVNTQCRLVPADGQAAADWKTAQGALDQQVTSAVEP
jgi:hypothetical protein